MIFFSDSKSMSAKEYFKIVLEILSNWKIIATVIAMLLIIGFSNFVVKYKHRIKKGKKKKNVAAASSTPAKTTSAPAPAASDSSASMESPDSIEG